MVYEKKLILKKHNVQISVTNYNCESPFIDIHIPTYIAKIYFRDIDKLICGSFIMLNGVIECRKFDDVCRFTFSTIENLLTFCNIIDDDALILHTIFNLNNIGFNK